MNKKLKILSLVCRTPKYDGTLKSAPNPDCVACKSPMVRVQSPNADGETRQGPMVLIRLKSINDVYA